MAALSANTLLELDREGFLWKLWEGDVVAYDRLSGDSHRLHDPAAMIIGALQGAPGPMHWGEIISACVPDDIRTDAAALQRAESVAESLIATGLLQYSVIDPP